MVIDILSEAAEIMFEDEDPKKIRIAKLHGDIPGHRDRQE